MFFFVFVSSLGAFHWFLRTGDFLESLDGEFFSLVFFVFNQGFQRVPCCLEVFKYFPGLPKSMAPL